MIRFSVSENENHTIIPSNVLTAKKLNWKNLKNKWTDLKVKLIEVILVGTYTKKVFHWQKIKLSIFTVQYEFIGFYARIWKRYDAI